MKRSKLSKLQRLFEPSVFLPAYTLLWWLFLLVLALQLAELLPQGRPNAGILAIALGLLAPAPLHSHEWASYKPWRLLVPLSVLASLVLRLIPLQRYTVPLGYDPGFYKFVFENPFSDLARTTYGLPFTLLLSGVNSVLGPEITLGPFFALLTALTPAAIYFLMRRAYGEPLALVTAGLFALSTAQFDVYAYNYYKNAFGLAMLLLTFNYFNRAPEKTNWPLILSGALLSGFHRPGWLLFIGSYLFDSLIRGIRAKDSRIVQTAALNLVAVMAISLLLNIDRIDTFLLAGALKFLGTISVVQAAPGGEYLTPMLYLHNSAGLVLLALLGIRLAPASLRPAGIALGLVTLMTALQLLFFRRFLLYLDFLLLPFAALGLLRLLKSQRLFAVLLLVLLAGQVLIKSIDSRPQINLVEYQDLPQIEAALPGDATLLTLDSHYAPWLLGWVDRAIQAPGMFDDPHSHDQWQEFWYTTDEVTRRQFLSVYPRPLYLHAGVNTPTLPALIGECYTPIDVGVGKLYRYDC